MKHIFNSYVVNRWIDVEVSQLRGQYASIQTLFLDDAAATVQELEVKIVLSSLTGMLNTIVSEVLSVKSYYIILTVSDSSWADIHRDNHWGKSICAGYSN